MADRVVSVVSPSAVPTGVTVPAATADLATADLGHGTLSAWTLTPATLAAALGSDCRNGLAVGEAERRLTADGANVLPAAAAGSGAARLLARQFSSPLVLILLFGAAVSMILREWAESATILLIVAGSATLSFVQELRASAAVDRLRQRLALKARVIRDGTERTVPATAIVRGDVVVLGAGNLVPADGIVLEATDFLVVEASLTGESLPVEKRPGVVAGDAPLAQRTNAVFVGSSVRSGTARVLVHATGAATALGGIAMRIAKPDRETDFARGVRRFGETLLRLMTVIVLVVVVANQLLGRPVVESLLFAVALAVGLSPELLPAIISVTMAQGARDMARQGVIVRRLESIENLGSMTVLCADKTGTLTSDRLELREALDASGEPSQRVRALAVVNATLETGIANALDAALVAAGRRLGLDAAGWQKVDEIPYDFQRRRLTIVARPPGTTDDRCLMVTKGAFDNVLEACDRTAGGPAGADDVALDEPGRQALRACFQAHGEAGFRVLAVATRPIGPRSDYTRADEVAMRFEGFLLFENPPKPDIRATLEQLAGLGVELKIITGDNRFVSAHLVRAVGMPVAAMLSGEEIARMSDDALARRAAQANLFVEVDPQQKERIVRALQRTGHAVGYLGDGINDAPALHAADVGISVDDAVDVARESADVVMLGPDLQVLKRGVEDGRRAFANTLKYIRITTSANFGNMISMAVGSMFLPFLPLSAKQILLNNLLSDVPSIAISTDRVDDRHVATPQRWHQGEIRRFMIVFGLVSSLFDLAAFWLLWRVLDVDEPAFQTAWFTLSLLTELAAALVLRTQGPMWRSAPGPVLLGSSLAVAGVALWLPFVAPLASPMDFVPLSTATLLMVVGLVIAYAGATELVKRRWFQRAVRGR